MKIVQRVRSGWRGSHTTRCTDNEKTKGEQIKCTEIPFPAGRADGAVKCALNYDLSQDEIIQMAGETGEAAR